MKYKHGLRRIQCKNLFADTPVFVHVFGYESIIRFLTQLVKHPSAGKVPIKIRLVKSKRTIIIHCIVTMCINFDSYSAVSET
jgi:hypothetical protein